MILEEDLYYLYMIIAAIVMYVAVLAAFLKVCKLKKQKNMVISSWSGTS